MKGYCLKCGTNREMTVGKSKKLKNGAKMVKGKCETCGSGMCAIKKAK